LSLATGHLTAHAILAALSAMQPMMPKIDQGIQARVSDQPNAATVAAIATVRAAFGNKFFPAKTRAAVTAVASFSFDERFIDKFHAQSLPNSVVVEVQQKSPDTVVAGLFAEVEKYQAGTTLTN